MTELGEEERKLALEDISMDDLEAELERRRNFKPKIEMVDNPDFTTLKKLCQNYIDEIYKERYDNVEEWEGHIYDAAIMAYFGKNVWWWIGNVCESR